MISANSANETDETSVKSASTNADSAASSMTYDGISLEIPVEAYAVCIFLRDKTACGSQRGTLQPQRIQEADLILDPPAGVCIKCRTLYHTGDKKACPWKSKGDTQARKKGREALRLLAEGSVINQI